MTKIRSLYYSVGMSKHKPMTAAEKLTAAYNYYQPPAWYKVTVVAEDGSAFMDIDALWRPEQAAAFKELSVGATLTVCRKVETCEPI